jgi:hypothetical protein
VILYHYRPCTFIKICVICIFLIIIAGVSPQTSSISSASFSQAMLLALRNLILDYIQIIEIYTIYLSKNDIVIIISCIRRVRVKISIMLLVLLPMLTICGVDGVGFSISCGNGGHNCNYGSQIEAGNGVDVSGHFSLHGDCLAGHTDFKGYGQLCTHETREDNAGDSVTLAAKGFLLPGAHYKQYWNGVDTSGPITGIQELIGTGSNIECISLAVNRNGLEARVSAGVGKGSIDIKQGATASEFTADAWQGINSAMGENIELNAETSDKLERNTADSSVKIDHGSLVNYDSEAQASQENGYIDLYAIHGAFNGNGPGSISGDNIYSKGATTSETGLKAFYVVNIEGKDKKPGSVEGKFDWGTETTSNGWVIAVPLESPFAWGGTQGVITVSASKISSYSKALDGQVVKSEDGGYAKDVSISNWAGINWPGGSGFAKYSEARKT